jgi:putative PIN family toxin of toxin-antitoxin system
VGKKPKVVIDTNVIISAFGWDGHPEEIIKLVNKGKIENFTSIEMINELSNAIKYPRLKFPESLQAEIIETIFSISSIVNVNQSLNIIDEDPGDNKVIECALSAKAEFIISGDKHLLELKKFKEIEILTPSEFLIKRVKNENI